jgi:hypothetical protein
MENQNKTSEVKTLPEYKEPLSAEKMDALKSAVDKAGFVKDLNAVTVKNPVDIFKAGFSFKFGNRVYRFRNNAVNGVIETMGCGNFEHYANIETVDAEGVLAYTSFFEEIIYQRLNFSDCQFLKGKKEGSSHE